MMMMMPELPAYTGENMRLCSPISTYGNSIAFFHQDCNSHCLDIWVMKRYGIVSSWTKALSLTMTSQGGFLSRDYIPRAVGFTRSGKILRPKRLRILGLLDISIILSMLTLRVSFCSTKLPMVWLHTNKNRTLCNHGW